MNSHEILKLLDAGYTKQEIEAMDATQETTEQIQPAADPEPTPAPPTEPAADPQPDDRYQALENKLNQLLGIVQNDNLNKGVDGVPKRSASDALASVIAPPRKEKK